LKKFNNLALFDLDNTLIPSDSDHLWTEFLVENKIISKLNTEISDRFFAEYSNGTLNLEEFLHYQLQPLKEIENKRLLGLRSVFIEKKIRPVINTEAIELVSSHLQSGDLCAIVTATNEFITEPIAKLFNVHKLIATLVEKNENGAYTGKSYGVPSFREGKIIRVNEWLKGNGLSLNSFKKSFFYSDSFNDIPLLKIVNNPVATNPDKKLKEYAVRNNWRVINIFNDV
jgi:HAD superfamily hydrolase (TIGR01490 family)